MVPEQQVTNRLAELRARAGISAAALAAKVGLSRQAIYSIEAGTYVPNTAVTLRLAQALNVRVDDIFALKQDPQEDEAELIPNSAHPGNHGAVQVCRIDDRLVAVEPSPQNWFLPPSDAVARSYKTGRVKLRLHRGNADLDNRILIAGCDPAMSILARYLQAVGIEAILAHRNSSDSLALLKQGRVHIAGTHLRDESAVSQRFSRGSVAVISLANWQEGLVVSPGNPKRIKSIEDLAGKRIRFLNREKGAGTRALLDAALSDAHLKSTQISGYSDESPAHLAAASRVAEGAVDCCIATEAAARAFALDFIPLQTARYDFVLQRPHLETAGIRALLDTVTRADFRRELAASAGYDTRISGNRVL